MGGTGRTELKGWPGEHWRDGFKKDREVVEVCITKQETWAEEAAEKWAELRIMVTIEREGLPGQNVTDIR